MFWELAVLETPKALCKRSVLAVQRLLEQRPIQIITITLPRIFKGWPRKPANAKKSAMQLFALAKTWRRSIRYELDGLSFGAWTLNFQSELDGILEEYLERIVASVVMDEASASKKAPGSERVLRGLLGQELHFREHGFERAITTSVCITRMNPLVNRLAVAHPCAHAQV